MNFQKPRKDASTIKTSLDDCNNAEDLTKMITGLQYKYRPKISKIKNIISLRQKIATYLR
jgi:hypothetical protein